MSIVSIHPKMLAEAFDNVVALCLDKVASYNDVVKVHWSESKLRVCGRGRYTASAEQREVLIEPDGVSSFFLNIHDLKDVASALKKVEGAGRAGTVVTMQVLNEQLVIRDGTQDLAVLDDADPERLTESTEDAVGLWEEMLEVMGRESVTTSPLAVTRDLLKRIDKVRLGKTQQFHDVFDFKVIAGNTVAVKLGPDMTVLLEAVEREGYERGGRYGDGDGVPGSLWTEGT